MSAGDMIDQSYIEEISGKPALQSIQTAAGTPSKRKVSFWAGCGLAIGGLSILCVLGGLVVTLLSFNSIRAFGTMMFGFRAYRNGEYDQAIQLYNHTLESKPESKYLGFIYLMRGLAYLDNRDFQRSLTDFARSIEHDPSNPIGYINRGLAYLELKNPNHALDDYNQALELHPEFTAGIYYGLGFVYWQLGNIQQAEAEFDRALSDYPQASANNYIISLRYHMYGVPEMWYLYHIRGNLKYEQSDYKGALLEYDNSIKLVTNYSVSWMNRCATYYMLGEYDKALLDCEKAVMLDPKNVRALDRRARVYIKLGRFDDAITDFKRIIELGTDFFFSTQAADELRKLGEPMVVPKITPTPLPTQ